MRRILLGITAAMALAGPALGQSVSECDWQASAWNLVEPWQDNSRTFANGKVRLALLDTIEPGAAPMHILVLSPPEDELGGRQCRTIGIGQGIGFSGVLFDQLTAAYDPSIGLTFRVPVLEYDADNGFARSRGLVFTLNQATGAIGVRLTN